MSEDLDLVIVGAGPAGLAAALYAARARLRAVAVERLGAGGQLLNVDQIENYPGTKTPVAGYDLGPAFAEQAMGAGARIEYGEVRSIEPSAERWHISGDVDFGASAVIIAGGSSPARLGVPGESEYEGSGVSYCATCDGDFFRGQEVMVVGGGDSAFDEAVYLSRICSRVHIAHRGREPVAASVLQERARANQVIEVHPRTTAVAIEGTDIVEAVLLRSEEDGRVTRLAVPGVFIYVGLQPNSAYLADLLPLDGAGHIPTDIWMATERPGIFAAGDIRQHSARQIATCVGDGVTAAIAAERYIRSRRAH